MEEKKSIYLRLLRKYRKYHRYIGLFLALFLCVSALTGILLGWKKDAAWIQPPTQKGSPEALSDWMPLDELAVRAETALIEMYPKQQNNSIDRMDVRPSKGMVKVLFKKDNWEVQVDGGNGAILSVAKRHSDWIEQLHDGSIISDGFKLVSMNVLGLGLLIMVLTGLWLWYGPRLIRSYRRNR